jgi:hypothetical protein
MRLDRIGDVGMTLLCIGGVLLTFVWLVSVVTAVAFPIVALFVCAFQAVEAALDGFADG